jgi:steroid delta-isomerase-like uncharacterized protein
MVSHEGRDGDVAVARGALVAAERYFEAWNRRDPEAVVRAFVDGGTYGDPTTGGELTGAAIGENAARLFEAFPDLAFEIASAAETSDGRVVGEWVMRGTNTGSFGGLPPTGLAVELPGVDVIVVEGDRVRSVRGYFDPGSLAKQLGLQVVVQPNAVGPVEFGTSLRLSSGKRMEPGAYSLTMLETHHDGETAEVRERSRQILGELAGMPGFISAVLGTVGRMMFTATAWEGPDDPRQLLREGGTHREAMQRFFGPGFTRGGVTTVLAPERQNAMWVRCEACGQMADSRKLEGGCRCGARLPEHPPYW